MSSNRAVTKRRLSMMAGSSLAAAWLLTMSGGAVLLAPAAALAANECGDPAGPDADTFNCSGTHASVSYVTDGALTLNIDDNLSITNGGLSVSGDDPVTVTLGTAADGVDFSIVNTAGAGVDIDTSGPGDTYAILYDGDPADGGASVSGTTHGMRVVSTGGSGLAFVYVEENVSVTGAIGLEVRTAGTSYLSTTVNGEVTATDTAILLDPNDAADITVGPNGVVTGGTGGAIRVVGGGTGTMTITNPGEILGRVDISTTGGTTFTNTGEWRTTGANVLSAGAASLTTSGLLATNAGAAATSIDFGTGGSLVSSGALAMGMGTEGAATLTLGGLESWANSAKVMFGVNGDLTGSDGVVNDRIVAHGADFEGVTNVANRPLGTLFMDVNFAAQGDCSAAVGADCLDLDGGSTSGKTAIVLKRAGNSPGGAAPVVLVDLGAPGGGAQGDFTISEFSDGYRRGQEGAPDTIEAGLFRYALRYLEATGQHALVGIPDSEIAEFGLVGDAAVVAWDSSTTSVFQRQADLRDAIGDNAPERAPGVWLRAASNKIDYTLLQHYEAFGASFTYNTSYAQKTQSLVGGIDLLNTAGAGSGWVVGLTAGRTATDLDFGASTSVVEAEGYSLGAYASLYGGSFFLDAIVNAAKLDLEYSNGAGLADSGEITSVGVQVEGGFRIGMAEDFAFVEPMVTLSHVTTEAPELDLSGVSVAFDEATTTRGALGVRVGGRLPFETFTATITGTGRVWQEFEGEDRVTFFSNGPDAEYATDTGEVLGDVGAGLGLFSNDLRFSAGVDVSHKFKQGYSSTDLSLSLRYWF